MTTPSSEESILRALAERYPASPGEIILHRLSGIDEPFRLKRWHKQTGDTIAIGDIVATVESASLDADIEAMEYGILIDQLYRCGDLIPHGSTIARITKNENGA